MTKKSRDTTQAAPLPAYLRTRSALTPESRTTRATDRLRGCEVFVKLAVGSESCAALRTEWQLLHRLAAGSFARPVEFRMLNSNTAYLTTEFIDGESFLTSPLLADEETFYSVVKQALESLSLIHHAGYIHGDIRPQNLMIAGDGDSVRVFWTDLEHAVEVDSASANMTYVEGFDDPELGNGHSQSPRTDLFALGRTILERVPDEADIRSGWGEVLLSMAEALCDPSPVDCLLDAEQAGLFMDKLAQDEGIPTMPPRPSFRPPLNIVNVEAKASWQHHWPAWRDARQGTAIAVTGAAGSGKTVFLRSMGADLALAGHLVLDLLDGRVAELDDGPWQTWLETAENRPVVMVDAADMKRFSARLTSVQKLPLVVIIESSDEVKRIDCDAHWTYPEFSQRRWYQWVTASI